MAKGNAHARLMARLQAVTEVPSHAFTAGDPVTSVDVGKLETMVRQKLGLDRFVAYDIIKGPLRGRTAGAGALLRRAREFDERHPGLLLAVYKGLMALGYDL